MAVSAKRCENSYVVDGDNPVKMGDDCHVVSSIEYSHPEMESKVMVVDVALSNVGVARTDCGALSTGAVAADVTLPVQ